jgi:hypothetical protein
MGANLEVESDFPEERAFSSPVRHSAPMTTNTNPQRPPVPYGAPADIYANWKTDRCPEHGHPWSVAGLCSTVDCFRTATDPVEEETNWNPPAVDPIEEAAKRGAEAGTAAGTWAIDGNTSAETVARILQGIEDGDPEVLDMQPAPLSGEWAGESIEELLGDLLPDNEVQPAMHDDRYDALLDAYEGAFGEAYWAEVERSARAVS